MPIEQVSQIRKHINGPRMSYLLRKNPANWNQLCSSLDLIEDTDEAIRAFDPSPTSRQALRELIGQRYLALYGVLQAMFVQQDAIDHLCESLGIPFKFKDFPRLAEIRDIRNASVGHPSKHGFRDRVTHNFLSRVTLNHPNDIRLLRFASNGDIQAKSIDIERLVDDQSKEMACILSNAESVLEKRIEDHRAKFSADKFSNAFPETLGYAFEKLMESFRRPELRWQASWAIDEFVTAMDDFRAALQRQEMDIDAFDAIELVYEELSYPIEELKHYLNKENSDIPNIGLAKVVATYVVDKMKELRELAYEMDSQDAL